MTTLRNGCGLVICAIVAFKPATCKAHTDAVATYDDLCMHMRTNCTPGDDSLFWHMHRHAHVPRSKRTLIHACTHVHVNSHTNTSIEQGERLTAFSHAKHVLPRKVAQKNKQQEPLHMCSCPQTAAASARSVPVAGMVVGCLRGGGGGELLAKPQYGGITSCGHDITALGQ